MSSNFCKHSTKLFAAFTLFCAVSTQALASASCQKHPKTEWLSEAEMKTRLEAQGYKIKKFKVDGNCYEIYGWDKDGKKVEVYFDTKDGSVVKSESHS